jgi:hypothetical protein
MYHGQKLRNLHSAAVAGVFARLPGGTVRLAAQPATRPHTIQSQHIKLEFIREQGAKFLKARKPGTKPNYWIAVDRDRDARGLFGIYESATDEYWQAIATGKTPGLRWAKKPGQVKAAP